MAYKFNPFTDTLDIVGSGGGSYIDGEVEYHSSLPVTVGTPAVNSAFLVRKGEGLYFISRKPAGIWVRELNNGNLDDWKYAGTFSDIYRDANFRIINDADTSKELAFSLSGLTTATTRTLTVPDASGTIARTEDFAAPPAIGNTTPAAGTFTTLSASTSLTLGTSGILSGGTNTIEQRNTTSGQTFRIYNTVSGTADANFERGFMRWSGVGGTFQIGTEKGGTGSARDLTFSHDGNTRLTINDRIRTGTTNLILGSASRLEWGAATTYLEASTSASPAYFKIVTGSTDRLNFDASGIIGFGGLTSLFPALKRSSTTLQVRLADDSAFAPFECAGLTLNGDLTASTRDIVTDTTTGTKIGTATTQKIGFFNATPVVQQAAIADATDAATTQARLNDLLATMRTFGLIAT